MARLPYRAAAAEALGTGALVMAVVGSGIMASRLSPNDVGLQLLENSLTTALALAVIIVAIAPVSGAHLNPVITVVDWWTRHNDPAGPTLTDVTTYLGAQFVGAIAGCVTANLMFSRPAIELSTRDRSGTPLWLGEVVATAGLVTLVFALTRTGRTAIAPAAVGAYIGAAYWFTSSTSFANPAVTIGRIFTDTFAGIAANSAPAFIASQFVGLVIGAAVVALLYPPTAPAVVHSGRRREDLVG